MEQHRRRLGDRPLVGRPLRSARVERGEAQELDPPGRPIRHPASRFRERDVVASLESHLDVRAGALHELDERRGAGQVLGQRLLAQRRDPAATAASTLTAWTDDGLAMITASALSKRLVEGSDARPDLGRHRGGACRIRLDEQDLGDRGQAGQQPRMHAAHAAGADDGDLHQAPTSASAARSTRIPIAAASAGRSHDESCSTISQPS